MPVAQMPLATRRVMPTWDDYRNFQLGPVLLYVDTPLDLFAPPPSPQGSLTGKFPHLHDGRSSLCTGGGLNTATEGRDGLLRRPSDKLPLTEATAASCRSATGNKDGVNRSSRTDRSKGAKCEKIAYPRTSSKRWDPSERPQPFERLTPSGRPADTPSSMDRGRSSTSPRPVCNQTSPAPPPPAPRAPLTPAQVTLVPLKPASKRLSWGDVPSPTSPTSPSFTSYQRCLNLTEPTSRNRLARRSTLTLSLPGASRHIVRQWRSSPIPSLAVRLVNPLASTLSEPLGVWEDSDDPSAPVRERISTCQDRITEHVWVLAYGAAALAQSDAPNRISHQELLDVSLPRTRRPGLIPPCARGYRRISLGWEPGTAWERERVRASMRIQHFEHLQEHYLGLMAEREMRTAHVRTYNWGCEREGMHST